jgi:hypothetical protein
MSQTVRDGEAGYWRRRAQHAAHMRLLSGYTSPPARKPTNEELDPHKWRDDAWALRDRELYLQDQTPGFDEAHVSFGRVDPQPKGRNDGPEDRRDMG